MISSQDYLFGIEGLCQNVYFSKNSFEGLCVCFSDRFVREFTAGAYANSN